MDASRSRHPIGLVVGSFYKLLKHIGGGSFGEIYAAEDTRTNKQVAVKLEPSRTRSPQLEIEYKIYTIFSGGTGVPQVYYYGKESEYNVLVMDLLGLSLEDIFASGRGTFTVKTVLMLADQMLTAIEYVHQKNFIHRDIKPDNFIMGTGNCSNQVFIIDFGLSKKYRDPTTKLHIPYVENKSLTGTARYASVNALKGCEQSRRDDLESLGYVWLYFLRGSLPWQGLPARTTKQKYERIMRVKAETPPEVLCQGFPQEFVTYFKMVRDLGFTEEPDYSAMRALFRELLVREGLTYDYSFDWSGERPVPMPSSSQALFAVPRPMPMPSPAPREAPRQPMTQPVTPKHSPRDGKKKRTQDEALPALTLRPDKKRATPSRSRPGKWSSPETPLAERKPTFKVAKLQLGVPYQPKTQIPSPKKQKPAPAHRRVMYRRWTETKLDTPIFH